MARPPKSGLEYFSMDVDMDSDEKVAFLIAKHGFMSFGLLVKLYMEIYRRGYFIVWDDRQHYLLAHQLGIDHEFTQNVVSDCVNGGIFDQNAFDFYNILTSHGIQARYIQATGRRVGVRFSREIFLLGEDEIKGAKIEFVPLRLGNNPVSVGINSNSDSRNGSFDSRNGSKRSAKTTVKANSESVNDDRNGVSASKTQNTEKGFPQQKFDNNPVSADINPSFGELSENDNSFLPTENFISDDRNEVSVSNTSAKIPQSKVNSIDDDDDTRVRAREAEDEFSEVAKAFSDNIHPITGEIEKDKLVELFEHYGRKWCMEAIKDTALNNGRTIRYIEKVLADWERNGFKAPKKQQRKEAVNSGRNGGTARKAQSKGDYSEYEEAERRQQQNRPWDVQSEPGGIGEKQGLDFAG